MRRGHTSALPSVDQVKHHPTTGGDTVKTMTCQDLGGPCDLRHQGATADDVINAQDRHLQDAVNAGDAAHQPARQDMKGRWRHPKKSLGWYRDVKERFSALPED
jgi:hypothetical protein